MGSGVCTGDLGRTMRNTSDDFIIEKYDFRGLGMMMQLQSRGGSYRIYWWEELDWGWWVGVFLFICLFIYF